MTKAVTTVAAMTLYEEGRFQLDDRVAKFLPEFADTPVWRGGAATLDEVEHQIEPMTIRHLMTHTSGLTYSFMNANVVDEAYRENGIEFPRYIWEPGRIDATIGHRAPDLPAG